MPTCSTCKKRYDHWMQLHDDIHNHDVINHFSQCITCYFRDVKIKELENKIDTIKYQIKEARRDIKLYQSNISVKKNELRDLENEKYGVI